MPKHANVQFLFFFSSSLVAPPPSIQPSTCQQGIFLLVRDKSKLLPCRKVLLWLFVPLIVIACIMVYITLAVCLSMAPTARLQGQQNILTIYTIDGKFIAPGAIARPSLAAHPQGAFWRSHMDANKTGMWNRLQYNLDVWNSQILRSVKSKSKGDHKSTLMHTAGGPCVFSLSSVKRALPQFDTLPLPIREFILRMLCRDFPLVIDQPQLCETGSGRGNETPPFLLLAIKSQDENYEQRQVIRETWGQDGQVQGRTGGGGLVRRLFLLGRSSTRPNRTKEELLKQENEKHRDLLRWDFKDTFFNLSLKDVLFWGWLSRHCPHARFIFKGDDDIFLRTPALMDYLQEQVDRDEQKAATGHSRTLQSFVVGDVIPLANPIRNNDSKYHIPEQLYTGKYPTYVGGGGVVYSGALALRLQLVSQRVILFPIDDVYVGMCLERLGVIPTHQPAFLTFDFPDGEEEEAPCAYHSILLVHKRSPEVVRRLWAETLQPPPECFNTTLRVEPTPKPKGKPLLKPKHELQEKTEMREIDIMDLM